MIDGFMYFFTHLCNITLWITLTTRFSFSFQVSDFVVFLQISSSPPQPPPPTAIRRSRSFTGNARPSKWLLRLALLAVSEHERKISPESKWVGCRRAAYIRLEPPLGNRLSLNIRADRRLLLLRVFHSLRLLSVLIWREWNSMILFIY